MPRAQYIAIALSTIILLPFTAAAQYSGVGVKGGPQANIYRATNIRTVPTPGLTLGIYAPIGAAPRLEFQPEVLVSMLGSGLVEPDGDRIVMRAMYIQAPISLKYFLSNEFNLHGGFQFGKILMAQRLDAAGTTEVRDQYRSFDTGFIMGAGLDMRSGLDITIRYYSGMPTLFKGDDALFPRNRSLHLTIGKRLAQMRRPSMTRTRR